MAENFGSGNTADHGACSQAASLCVAIEEAGGIQISGTGGIDNVFDRFGFNISFGSSVDNDRSFGGAGYGSGFNLALNHVQGVVKIRFFEQSF